MSCSGCSARRAAIAAVANQIFTAAKTLVKPTAPMPKLPDDVAAMAARFDRARQRLR